ncbi:hypothetical protein J4E08_00710 [Sagittula sp. NFXS13]|uniref:hypothetical protein n=1 Tax=Sagittula sp. NFXS13 TaxID=2819095 RepID=UPI0032DED132
MVPNFALALSFEGIALLRRLGPSWAVIEEVAIDHPDLDVAVIAMRDRAEVLDPKGADVALIIPNEQIRYADLPDPGGDPASWDTAIRTTLDGATPYALDDLVWDAIQAGGRLQIAAVARDTLTEAEIFARDHGFTPICHLAHAETAQFEGAVFFGKADGWPTSVDRPAQPLHIVPASPEALTPVTSPDVETARPPEQAAESEPVPETPQDPEDLPAEQITAPHDASSGTQAEHLLDEAPAPTEPEPKEPVQPSQALAEDTSETSDLKTTLAQPEVETSDVNGLPEHTELETGEDADILSTPPASPAAPEEQDPLPVSFASSRGPRSETDMSPAPSMALGAGFATPPKATEAIKPRFTPFLPESSAPNPETAEATPRAEGAPLPKPDDVPPAPAASTAEDTSSTERAAPEPSAAPEKSELPADTKAPSVVAPVTTPLGPVAPSVQAKSLTADTPDAASPAPSLGPAARPDTASSPSLGAVQTDVAATSAVKAPVPTRNKSAKPGKPSKRPSRLGLRRASKSPDASEPPAPIMPTTGSAAPQLDSMPERSRSAGPTPLARLAALRSPGITGPALAKARPTPPAPSAEALTPLALKLQPDRDQTEAPMIAPEPKPTPADTDDLSTATPAKDISDDLPVNGPATSAPKSAKAKPAKDTRSAAQKEREQMTVFGARNRAPERQTPRATGLVLTAALVLLLLGIGAWSSVFMNDGVSSLFGGDDEPAVATSPQEAAPDDIVLLPEETAPEVAPAEETVATLQPSQPVVEPDLPTLSTDLLTRDEAAATYAATGIWQRAPAPPNTPPTDGVENVYVASIDPTIPIFDAIALPKAPNVLGAPVPTDPGLPPPAGMTFDIDERGVVRATPEGALTPDGLRVYTGPPPVVPPLRNAVATPAALPGPAPDPAPDAAPDPAPITNPLGQKRPEARPDDVVEQQERATLGGISLDELEGFRPAARPLTVQEQAVVDEPEARATAQAVRASLQPVTRPRNMTAIVERAEKERPTEAVQTAAVAPRTVQPSAPSSASVASSATVRNAIRLNRINLIGVYGTPANRRALVRLPSGKYQKVQVGDRLDGGRVAAIGESELRYSKGGRNLTLQMPRG